MERKRQANSLKVPTLSEGEAETPKALLNDVVLQNIFKYLGYKDLKIIRAVKNTIWLRNSKKAWWSQTKVNLKKGKLEEYLNHPEINTCVKNYRITYFRTDDYQGFWEHFGHSIKYLEIDFCERISVEEFRQIIYTKCPNLEKLVAKLIHLITNATAVEPMKWQEPQFGQQKNLKFLKLNFSFGNVPLSWMELLSHFPNLEALETRSEVDICKVISIIRQHDPTMLKLRHLDIQGLNVSDFENSSRLVLLDPNLSFETIRIGHGNLKPETLANILDRHGGSLRDLSLAGYNTPFPTQILPRQPLRSLENLSLSGHLFNSDIFRFTPNVRKILFSYNGDDNLINCADSNLTINTCKELTISVDGEWTDAEKGKSDLQFFLNAFPNVQVLYVSHLDNSKFSMICERWTKLVSLTGLHCTCQVDDFGLLGFNPESKTETVRNPNITNLQALQTLSMSAECPHDNPIEMKNGHVVLEQLKKLPQLKKFDLWGYKLNEEYKWREIFAKYSGDH